MKHQRRYTSWDLQPNSFCAMTIAPKEAKKVVQGLLVAKVASHIEEKKIFKLDYTDRSILNSIGCFQSESCGGGVCCQNKSNHIDTGGVA